MAEVDVAQVFIRIRVGNIAMSDQHSYMVNWSTFFTGVGHTLGRHVTAIVTVQLITTSWTSRIAILDVVYKSV